MVETSVLRDEALIAPRNVDEDEIKDKVFSKYSIEGKDHNGQKNGIKILMK